MERVKRVAVIDGQGGRLGRMIVEKIKEEGLKCCIRAVGTNTLATNAMLKAGADEGATGENPVIVACRKADVIIGPVGILSADALLGEITERMAVAVGVSSAEKILLPMNMCNATVVGAGKMTFTELVDSAIDCLKQVLERL